MDKTAIVTDTNSGLTPQEAQKLGIGLIPMPVILDGECFFEYTSITPEEFFQCLKEGEAVSTSQPAPGDLVDAWENLLETHEEVVYIPMSSGLSGGYQTAAMLAQDYEGRVEVANLHRISVTQHQAALDALFLAGQGRTAREIKTALEQNDRNSDIFVAVNTLELLKKSGRVTAAGAALGSILSIKPVLRIQDGKLDAYRKVRGMRAAMEAMVEGLIEDQRVLGYPHLMLRAAYAGDLEAGMIWQETLQAAFSHCTVGLDPLPLSVCCHVGYGALGVGIAKDIPATLNATPLLRATQNIPETADGSVETHLIYARP